MASLRKAKKQAKKEGRVFIDPTKNRQYTEKELLMKQIKAQVEATNRRLKSLDKAGFYNSFSSKKLFDRLGGKVNVLQKTKKGKITNIKLRKNMSETDLTAVAKATKSFLRGDTSKVTKLKKTIKDTKKSMFRTLKGRNDNLTMEDIETYYKMLGDKDFDFFSDKQLSSDVWAIIQDAKEMDLSKDEFLKRINEVVEINDVDIRNSVRRLYDRYVLEE